MPTRELLTPMQRLPFLGIPSDLDERDIARYYTFSAADLTLIKRRRRPANRLGFAVQLTFLRFPGFPWDPKFAIPSAALTFLATQIGESLRTLETYAGRAPTRFEHLAEIQRVYGYRSFTRHVYRDLSSWLMPLALSTDQGLVLVEALVEELRMRRVIQPALSTLEQLGWEARRRAQRRIYFTLAGHLSTAQQEQLDLLLRVPVSDDATQSGRLHGTSRAAAVLHHRSPNSSPSGNSSDGRVSKGEGIRWGRGPGEPGGRRTPLSWLREPSGAATPSSMLKVIERLQAIRAFGLNPALDQSVHAHRLRQLAREGEKYSPQALARFEPLRRYATLAAYLLDLSARLTDTTLEMHDHLIGRLFARGRKAHLAQFEQRGKDINRTVRLYATVGKTLIQARADGRDPYTALEEILPWRDYVESVDEAAEQARPDNFDYLDLLDDAYDQIHKYVPKLLDAFTFHATPTSQAVVSVVDALALVKELGRKKVPDDAPHLFVKARWEPYVFTDHGINRRYYEMCALTELRNGLRSGDISVEGSQQYRDFDAYLLPAKEWEALRDADQAPLGVPRECAVYLAARRAQMDQQMRQVATLLEANQLPGVRVDAKKAHFAPLEPEIPPGVDELTRLVYSRVRRIKITRLIQEVDALTGFSRHFTHLHSGAAPDDPIALYATLLAQATNLGLAKMADATPGMTFKRLAWVDEWYLREECYTKALAEIINYHHQLAFAAHWGDGTSSSSDGQRFPVGGRRSTPARINAKYGAEPSLVFITHISDQYGPYHTKAITGTAKEAPYLVDGLLYHETALAIQTHSSDTGGYSDQIFGICALLGFQYAPRLRDVGDRKLFPFERPATYPALKHLIGGVIHERQVETQWEDLRRLATSLKLGTVAASQMLKKLAAYPRQNGLAWGLREVGRIEKSLYLLHWYQDLELRRQVLIRLNKGEGRNALARAVAFYRHGAIQDRSQDAQQERAQGVNLIVAAIILWNTLELDRVITELRAEGREITEDQLRHLSPMDWEHLSLTGDYVWDDRIGRARRTRSAHSARRATAVRPTALAPDLDDADDVLTQTEA